MARYRGEGERALMINAYQEEGEHVVFVRNPTEDPLIPNRLARLELRSAVKGTISHQIAVTSPMAVVSYAKDAADGTVVVFSLNAKNEPNHVAEFGFDVTAADVLATVLLTNGSSIIVVAASRWRGPSGDLDGAMELRDRLRDTAKKLGLRLLDVISYDIGEGRYGSLLERGEME